MSAKRHRGYHGRYAKRVSPITRVRTGTAKTIGYIGSGLGSAGRGVVRVVTHPAAKSSYKAAGRGARAVGRGSVKAVTHTARGAYKIGGDVAKDIGGDILRQIIYGEAGRRIKVGGRPYRYGGSGGYPHGRRMPNSGLRRTK